MAEEGHRTGVVALLGRPNAGKSTLLNRLLGEKLAIVTAKPQTTRSRILGIMTRPEAQLLLLDTPGFHDSERALGRAMKEAVERAARDCDVALLLVDPTRGFGADHVAQIDVLHRHRTPVLLVATKQDRQDAAGVSWPPEGAPPVEDALGVSAATGEGIESLIASVIERLPFGPSHYDDDALTDRPMRFLAAELIREAAFEELAEEVPYSLAVEVDSFDESDERIVRIHARLLVERASQKAIVIGAGGRMIRSIGTQARREIEKLIGQQVFLDLWVKEDPRWSRNPKRLKSLGYH